MTRLVVQSAKVGVPLAILAGILPACGPGPGIPIDDLVARYSAAECATFARCYLTSDEAYCLSQGMNSNPLPFYGQLAAKVAAAKAGKIKYDGVAAQACLDAWANLACDAWQGSNLSVSLSCFRIFSGRTVKDGDPCTVDQECMRGSTCVYSHDVCSGVCTNTSGPTICTSDSQCTKSNPNNFCADDGWCTDPTPSAAGETCGARDSACQPGLYCCYAADCFLTTSSDGVCVPLGNMGEPCYALGGCADGLVCLRSSSDQPPTCMKLAAKGEACQVQGQCGGVLMSSISCDLASQTCVDACGETKLVGDGCDPSASYCSGSTCTPYAIASIGEACGSVVGGLAQCEPTAYCLPGSVSGQGTCAPLSSCTP